MAMRKSILAVLVCAVFTAVLAAPLVQSGPGDEGTLHTILKYENGPPSTCAVTWTFTAPGDGIWYGHVVNYGMRWIIVDMTDADTGELLIDRHMYRFAVYGNEFDIEERIDVVVDHDYEITVTPNGPLDTYVTFEDIFEGSVVPNEPPVAAFTWSIDGLTVSVDASGSDDSDGTIESYSWDWGDGTITTGMTSEHTYTAPETFSTRAPPVPYVVVGCTYASDGTTPLADCDVTITDVTSAGVWTTTSGSDGKYTYVIEAAEGDLIRAEAVKGTLYGMTEDVAAGGLLQLDIVLYGEEPPEPFDVVITLTVTDDDGATATVSQTLTLYP